MTDQAAGTGVDTRPADREEPAGIAGLAPWAWRPLLVVVGALAVLLTAVSTRYGYFVDELYFLVAGERFSWGYADQPWLLPWLADAMDSLAPDSLLVLRLPATLATAASVLVSAGLARELGGGRRAQVLAAAVHASSFGTLWTGHLLATSTLDPPLWAAVCWLLVRWTRRHRDGDHVRQDRLLLAAAAVTAVALQVKYMIPILWCGLLLGLVVVGPRAALRRPALWVGLVVAASSTLPALAWQAANGWPQLAMGATIGAENGGTAGRIAYPLLALVWAGVISGAALAVHGIVVLWRRPELAPYRFLGVAVVLCLAVYTVLPGHPYYSATVFGPLWAASAVAGTCSAGRWWRVVSSRWTLGVSAALAAVIALPLLPVGTVDPGDRFLTRPGSTGWTQLADQVAAVAPTLPPDTVIVTAFYPQAAAIERGRHGRFPFPVVSGSRGYWFLAAPPPTADHVLAVGRIPALDGAFRQEWLVGTYHNPHGHVWFNNTLPLSLHAGRTVPWPSLWGRLRDLPPVPGPSGRAPG